MHSPELYEEEINRYCTYKKLELSTIYSDIDYSAFRGARTRPSLEQLVERRKDYSAVIVPKLSRFGRSMKELVRLFGLFDADRVPLVFLDMNLDTSTSQGRLLRHILAAFAEYESDVKADYTRATHRRIRAEGRPWGTAPYGYVRGSEPATWEIDPVKGAVVAEIYGRYLAGSSANAIAMWLNREDIPTARALMWKGQAIGKMLDNPAYAGLSQIDHELVPAQWAPIVSRATWEAVRARRAADPHRAANLGRTKPHMPYLLSGMVWCGQCGRKMTHTTRNHTPGGTYNCASDSWGTWGGCLNARVDGPLLEAFVTEVFLDRCAFTILTEVGELAGSPRQVWKQAGMPDRKRLLGLVISKVVATPVDPPVPKEQRRVRLNHDIDIQWRSEVAAGEEIAVASIQAPPKTVPQKSSRPVRFRRQEAKALREGDSVPQRPSSVGKTWAQYRRELHLAREGDDAVSTRRGCGFEPLPDDSL
jgi:DNA invertase Pin-like site-specific DNA recombinase